MHWPRSLYWRIALGFVLCLAATLVVQAMLFVWVASRSGPVIPGQPPDRFAQTVSIDLAGELERDSSLDLAQYVRDEYGSSAYQFFVVLADGRVISNASDP